MENQVAVEILYRSPEYVKIKFPYLEVPIKMSHHFFMERVKAGYFKIEKLKNKISARKRLRKRKTKQLFLKLKRKTK